MTDTRWTMPLPLWHLVKARLNSVIWYGDPLEIVAMPLVATRNRIRAALRATSGCDSRLALGFPADEARVVEDVLLDLKAEWATLYMEADSITVERNG